MSSFASSTASSTSRWVQGPAEHGAARERELQPAEALGDPRRLGELRRSTRQLTGEPRARAEVVARPSLLRRVDRAGELDAQLEIGDRACQVERVDLGKAPIRQGAGSQPGECQGAGHVVPLLCDLPRLVALAQGEEA